MCGRKRGRRSLSTEALASGGGGGATSSYKVQASQSSDSKVGSAQPLLPSIPLLSNRCMLNAAIRTAKATSYLSPFKTLLARPTAPAVRYLHTTKVMSAAAASTNTPSELAVPTNKTAHAFDKSALDALLLRRFFFAPSFEIYGGTSAGTRLGEPKLKPQVSQVCMTMGRPARVSRRTSLTHGGNTTLSRRTCWSWIRPL